MQKRVRKCYGYKEQIWQVEEFQLAGGDGDRVSGTPVSALSPFWELYVSVPVSSAF